MKTHLLASMILFLTITSCYSQTKHNDLSKYAGTYYLLQKDDDTVIKYDYITFYMKDGKLYCSRDFMLNESSVEASKSNMPQHNDYEIKSIDLKTESIVLQYMSSKCAYRFKTNSKGKLELIIREDVLVYEKR